MKKERKREMENKKKIVVIQRGVTQRKEDEERTQGERRDEQWESVRQHERSSERRREAEELGEKVGEELKAAAREEELKQEEWENQKGDEHIWHEVKGEVEGVMEGYKQCGGVGGKRKAKEGSEQALAQEQGLDTCTRKLWVPVPLSMSTMVSSERENIAVMRVVVEKNIGLVFSMIRVETV